MSQLGAEAFADRLPVVRHLLSRLHQALIAAERNELEQERGPVGAAELLQRLVDDERFAWLRPMGQVVARLDLFLVEAAKTGAPIPEKVARELLHEVRRVVGRTTGLHAGWRYADWVKRDPEIVLAHSALSNALLGEPGSWAA
ncbi:MAG TPA: hypothetical protein VFO95_18910 [Gemmatimonadales bacterium]|nr:hypothetical protein [Gemmatimonadales bacterium]